MEEDNVKERFKEHQGYRDSQEKRKLEEKI